MTMGNLAITTRGEPTGETRQFSGCSSRKNDASTWDECKNAQLKESCIRMLKECNLNENEKTELRRIENELKKEFEGVGEPVYGL